MGFDTYAPTIAVITPRAIPDNLIAWCLQANRQAGALLWASGIETYKLVKTYQNSLAEPTKPVYPCIAFSDDDDIQEVGGDSIEAVYRCTFELSIQNRDPDVAVTQARIYAKAFCSMFVNCPSATMAADTNSVVEAAKIQTLEVGFVPILTNEKQNDFLQKVQIRITVSLFGVTHI